jgi:hypothetical protein
MRHRGGGKSHNKTARGSSEYSGNDARFYRGTPMNKTTLLAAIALCVLGTGYADYGVMDKGVWPATWPKELEPLRKQARTLVGPMADNQHFAITFTKREELEAAWPHLLKVKSPGAPVILVRGPNFFLEEGAKAGVVIHGPPAAKAKVEGAIEQPKVDGKTEAGLWKGLELVATYIELVVDGEIVDLNRLPLPADTPILDERFKDAKGK